MADTTIDPNNRAVVYRGKPVRERPRTSSLLGSPQQSAGPADALRASDGAEFPDAGFAHQQARAYAKGGRIMPSVSKAQNAAMHAAAAGKSTLGIPKKVGAEFTSAQAPGSVKNLPQYAPKKLAKGGKSKVGEPVLVGEKGPELFVADKPGTVVPNNQLRMKRKSGAISDRALQKRPRLAKYAGNDMDPIDASSR